jgi:hypothetical protein
MHVREKECESEASGARANDQDFRGFWHRNGGKTASENASCWLMIG